MFDFISSPSIELLIFLWLMYIMLSYVWGGLRNLVRLILFPGVILHMAAHSYTAKILGIPLRLVFVVRNIMNETPIHTFFLKKASARSIVLFSISPMLLSVPLSILLLSILKFSGVYYPIILWLTYSFFITGNVSTEDLSVLVNRAIVNAPHVVLALSLTPIITILISISFGLRLGLIIGVLHFFAVIVISILFREKETIIIDEEI